MTALAFFPSLEELAAAAVAVKEAGVQPYIMEFLDEEAARVAAAATGAGVEAEGAMLLVSVDVNREAALCPICWANLSRAAPGGLEVRDVALYLAEAL